MKLTIVGLGPGSADDVTRKAWRVLQAAPELYLRTAKHPAVAELGRAYHSFDALYEAAEDFKGLYEAIVTQVLALARRPEGVVYAVTGHPLVGEYTVLRLLQEAGDIPVEIVDGLSFIEPSLSLLGIDGMDGLQVHDAAELIFTHHPPLNPDYPVLLGQVYNREVAAQVKLTLMNQYPDEHPVILIHEAGLPSATKESLALYEIDRSPHIAHLSSLYLPPLPQASSFERFQETIAHLRAPEGCPWDREQTHQSLRPYLLEESYEVLEALDQGDMAALCEELGDLLLQVVLHSQIAIEEGNFSMAQILAGINAKIIRRHPHVWGEAVVKTTDDLQKVWAEQKAAEKTTQGPESILGRKPPALPALMRAWHYQSKAAKVGFDWPEVGPVLAKIQEEIAEIQAAPTDEERAKEVGDLLFAVVNWARWLKVEPEEALRGACGRFRARFEYIEAGARAQNKPLEQMTLAEMDALWEAAKRAGQ
jgi:tetrapyrrole methylase family protein/MazG family protein